MIEVGKDTEDNRQELRGKKVSKVAPNIGGFYWYECPAGYATTETQILIGILLQEENPVLIHPGTWLDQPQWYVDAVRIFQKEKAEWQKKNSTS